MLISKPRGRYRSQKANAQTASATGSAKSRPRAKLRLPLPPKWASLKSPKGSFIGDTSSIATDPLLLSASVDCNKPRSDTFRRPRVHARKIGDLSTRRPGKRSDVIEDLLVCLTLFPLMGSNISAGARGRRLPPPIRVKPGPGQVRRCGMVFTFKSSLLLTGLALSRPVAAQDAKVLTPVEIFDPDTGEGLRVGPSVVALPELDADATYNTNIYDVETNRTDDFVFSLRPSLTLRTDLPRHEFSIRGAGEFRRYADTSSEDSDQFEIVGSGRLDLASRTEVDLDGGFRRGIEQRGTAGDLFLTDRPVEYNQTFGAISIVRTGGFIEMLGEAHISEFDYKNATLNGKPLDLSDRNVTIRRARVRASAPTGRNTRIFFELSGNQVRYQNAAPQPRNSNGFGVLAGVQRNITNLLTLEAAVGYLQQDFKDPAVKTVRGFNYHFLLNWTPTPNWQITGSADRDIDRSPREDIPAILDSTFKLQASNAVSDRLLFTAEAGVEDEEYRGSALRDRRYFVNALAHYRLTNRVGLIAEAGYRTQNGDNGARDYHGFAVSLGVRMAL